MWYFCNSRWSHSQTENKPKRRAKYVNKDRSPVPAVTESFRTGDISFSWISKASASILNCATETCQWGEGKWLCKNYQKKIKRFSVLRDTGSWIKCQKLSLGFLRKTEEVHYLVEKEFPYYSPCPSPRQHRTVPSNTLSFAFFSSVLKGWRNEASRPSN